jgi:putative transport protein
MNVTVSRIRRAQALQVEPATSTTRVGRGDLILAVGTARHLDQFQRIVGCQSTEDLTAGPGPAAFQRVFVTRKAVLGRTVAETGLEQRHGVTVTRVVRSNVEMAAFPGLRLQFGDLLHLVGPEGSLPDAAAALGNSTRAMNETQFIPIFTGIALGILLGLMPISFPGLPEPVRLGLAGGPLILAIVVSRVGNIGPLVWYMPPNANLAVRELGITLFLACVGLKAGTNFFASVFSYTGLLWLVAAAVVTMVPLLVVGWIGRQWLKLNYVHLAGLLSGSMTDPPALAFANNITQSEAPSMTYATVYPLTMILRIVSVQILVLLLCR